MVLDFLISGPACLDHTAIVFSGHSSGVSEKAEAESLSPFLNAAICITSLLSDVSMSLFFIDSVQPSPIKNW